MASSEMNDKDQKQWPTALRSPDGKTTLMYGCVDVMDIEVYVGCGVWTRLSERPQTPKNGWQYWNVTEAIGMVYQDWMSDDDWSDEYDKGLYWCDVEAREKQLQESKVESLVHNGILYFIDKNDKVYIETMNGFVCVGRRHYTSDSKKFWKIVATTKAFEYKGNTFLIDEKDNAYIITKYGYVYAGVRQTKKKSGRKNEYKIIFQEKYYMNTRTLRNGRMIFLTVLRFKHLPPNTYTHLAISSAFLYGLRPYPVVEDNARIKKGLGSAYAALLSLCI